MFQGEAKCEFIDMKTYFYFHVNKTHFHNKSFAFSLVLKVESLGIQKWPVEKAVCLNQAVPFLRNVSEWLQTELIILKMLKITS